MRGFRKSMPEKAFAVFNIIFMVVLCALTLYPFIYVMAYSLNEGADATQGGIYFFPRKFTLFNYQYVLTNGTMQSAYVITIGRTLLGTTLGLFVTGVTAYGASFRNLPGRKYIMFYILIPMLFSGGLVPYYIQLSKLHLINSFWVFVIPGMFNIWNMFVLMKFFMGIPESLRESAIIDGANEMVVLWKIIVPVAAPAIAAIALFTAVGHWNDWFTGAFFVNNIKLIPVQTYLQRLLMADSLGTITGNQEGNTEAIFRASQSSNMTLKALKTAAVIVGTLPVLFVYPFLQRYFVKGVLVGSIKG
ncbi:MAG: carbohydrate ABC transporter permease [Treponema sp.]|jgi:putative aldouronate transport system permease protein|nr:carbohydrate ABC transporter permease [Treponema sp.]